MGTMWRDTYVIYASTSNQEAAEKYKQSLSVNFNPVQCPSILRRTLIMLTDTFVDVELRKQKRVAECALLNVLLSVWFHIDLQRYVYQDLLTPN